MIVDEGEISHLMMGDDQKEGKGGGEVDASSKGCIAERACRRKNKGHNAEERKRLANLSRLAVICAHSPALLRDNGYNARAVGPGSPQRRMFMLLNCLAVGTGGFIGSILRYLITAAAPHTSFPWVTLAINVVGTFILGTVAALVLREVIADGHLSLMIRVGLCGGFTTIGAFSLDTMDLIQQGAYLGAFGYSALTCVLCVGAAFAASALVRAAV